MHEDVCIHVCLNNRHKQSEEEKARKYYKNILLSPINISSWKVTIRRTSDEVWSTAARLHISFAHMQKRPIVKFEPVVCR